MKYILTLTALAVYAIATTGCVHVERDEPVTTRTTTIDTPVTPAVTTTTTQY